VYLVEDPILSTNTCYIYAFGMHVGPILDRSSLPQLINECERLLSIPPDQISKEIRNMLSKLEVEARERGLIVRQSRDGSKIYIETRDGVPVAQIHFVREGRFFSIDTVNGLYGLYPTSPIGVEHAMKLVDMARGVV